MVRRALWAAAAGMGLLVVLLTAVSAVAAETSTAAAGPGSDGHACWNEINSAWEQAPTYVHRRITAMFPEITQDSVAQAFEEGPEARVAVVPRPQLPPAQLAEELYREQGRRTVVLYTWQGDAFRADVVTGADLPRGKRTLAGPSRWVAPDDLHVHLEVVSVILQGRVLATAAQRLAETSLYVAPGLPTDLTAQQVRGLARQLAELPEPVRVALLPRDAVEYEGGVVRRGVGNIAELVQGQRDVSAVVYLVDEDGRVTAGSASSAAVGIRSRLPQSNLSQIVAASRDSDSATATLTALTRRLESGSEGNSVVDRLVAVLLYAVPFLIVLGVGALCLIPIRGERETTWPVSSSDGETDPASQTAGK